MKAIHKVIYHLSYLLWLGRHLVYLHAK